MLHYLASLLDGHRAVQPDTLVATHRTQLGEHVERLRVVGHEYHFVIGVGLDGGQEVVEHGKLAGQVALELFGTEIGREELESVLKTGLLVHTLLVDELRI